MSAAHKLALAAFWTEHPLCALYAIAHGTWQGRAFRPAESWSLRALIAFAEPAATRHRATIGEKAMGHPTINIVGAGIFDTVFDITLVTGEEVTWNVTKLQAAARTGKFGPPRHARTSDLPPACWEKWGGLDRAKVDAIKRNPAALDEPAIAIASPRPEFAILCFADGQHRMTARQELGLDEISFYLVPQEAERAYRVEVVITGGPPT